MSNSAAAHGEEAQGAFLVVDEDASSARTLARWIRAASWEPFVARTFEWDELARLGVSYGAAIISLDKSNDLKKIIRMCQATLPPVPLALLGKRDVDAVVEAQAVGIHYICRPAHFASVFGFADAIRKPLKVAEGPFAPESPCRDLLVESGKRLGLPPKEAQILVVGGETSNHKDLCARLGTTENTLKTLVKRILARARRRGIRAGSLKELVARLRNADFDDLSSPKPPPTSHAR